jgi:hypothetical protein
MVDLVLTLGMRPVRWIRWRRQMTRLRSAARRALFVAATTLAVAGTSAGAAQAGEADASTAGSSEAIFEGFGQDLDAQVAVSEAEMDARALAASVGFVDCSVIDVEVLLPPTPPDPEPFPIEMIFGARVTISCAD